MCRCECNNWRCVEQSTGIKGIKSERTSKPILPITIEIKLPSQKFDNCMIKRTYLNRKCPIFCALSRFRMPWPSIDITTITSKVISISCGLCIYLPVISASPWHFFEGRSTYQIDIPIYKIDCVPILPDCLLYAGLFTEIITFTLKWIYRFGIVRWYMLCFFSCFDLIVIHICQGSYLFFSLSNHSCHSKQIVHCTDFHTVWI